MSALTWLVVAPWFVLFTVWTVTAVGRKRHERAPRLWQRELALRLAVIVLVVLASRVSIFGRAAGAPTTDLARGIVGATLCTLGATLAIWARVVLGRNWGMPMARADDPALITRGPYARIRHPIYGGFLLIMLGTAIGDSLIWVIPLLVFGAYFAYGARREEADLLRRFPDAYPAYRRRTRMFLPFPWRRG